MAGTATKTTATVPLDLERMALMVDKIGEHEDVGGGTEAKFKDA